MVIVSWARPLVEWKRVNLLVAVAEPNLDAGAEPVHVIVDKATRKEAALLSRVRGPRGLDDPASGVVKQGTGE